MVVHPELFGGPVERSIEAARHPGVMKMAKEGKTRLTSSPEQ
jgi:hypothetical protein